MCLKNRRYGRSRDFPADACNLIDEVIQSLLLNYLKLFLILQDGVIFLEPSELSTADVKSLINQYIHCRSAGCRLKRSR